MYDVVIVGGGPAGLNAALVLGRTLRKVLVVDEGRPRNRLARRVHGFLGWDGAAPSEIIAKGRKEVAQYGVEVIDDTVVEITPEAEPRFPTQFAVITRRGGRHSGRKVLLATGLRDLLPEIPGLDACYGKSVHHCPYCDAYEYRGQHLLACGENAKSATGLGLLLRSWTKHVTVLTQQAPVDECDRRNAEIQGITFATKRIDHLESKEGVLTSVVFADGSSIQAVALFFNTSSRQHSPLPAQLGCCPEDDQMAETSSKQRTPTPGIYVAGDADGDVQFAVVAAGEGAVAAVAIHHDLDMEDRRLRVGPNSKQA